MSGSGDSRFRVLIDEERLQARIAELAIELKQRLTTTDPVLLGLLTGSFVFVADLARAMWREGLQPHVDFVKTKHYEGTQATSVRVEKPPSLALKGRHVLLVDDILDTGRSLELISQLARDEEAASLLTCVLLDKPSGRLAEIEADLVGFTVDDEWVLGYGLDLDGAHRELPHVVVRDDESPS
ncbi:MAG: phosphoribosyltransferase family protein [Acidobacteriota bacterium]